MAPIRRIRQHGQRTTSNATVATRPLCSNVASSNNPPHTRDDIHDNAGDDSNQYVWVEASHTILTEDEEIIKIYSRERIGIDQKDGRNGQVWGEPAIYSTDGALCHSHNELYPRKGARLVSSRPTKKASRHPSTRALQRSKTATYNWPDAKNTADIAAFCKSGKIQQSNSLNDIESLEAPSKLTIDDLRRMRCAPRSRSRSSNNARPLRLRASKTLFNDDVTIVQSFVYSNDANSKKIDADVETDVDNDGPDKVNA